LGLDQPLRLPRGRAIALNAGSSSLKAALFADREEVARRETALHGDPIAAIDRAVGEVLDEFATTPPNVVVHRIVHGGPQLHAPTTLDDAVVEQLSAATALAPLHQPVGLAVVAAARKRLPTVRHMACFDTDFGWELPALSARLPIPERYAQRGLRRYGFHGLSYEYLLRTYSRTLGSRAVIAHLGSGSSAVAVRDGRPVDTSMALTPLGGVVMSTRSGDLDPGVVCAMARADGNIDATEHALAYESGLRALSGTTGDLAELVRVASSDDAARLAVDAYVASVAKVVAGFVTVLGGLDSMLFTGGVGVHNATVRSAIVERLGALNLTFEAHFVPTDEERMMAWHALHALAF